jgi:uncharacterized protein (DUF4415 family)
MRKNAEHIVSYTAAELKAKRARGESKSDWKAAAKKPLPDGSDPDDAMPDDSTDELEWATSELPLPRRKAHMTLRIDADVLDWFRAQGRGYQTKINAILRKYYETKVG